MGSKSATGTSGTTGTTGGAGQAGGPGGPGQSLYNNSYGVPTDSGNRLYYYGGNGGVGGTGGTGGAAGKGGAGGAASTDVHTTLSSTSSTYAYTRAHGGSGGGAGTPGSGGGGANGGAGGNAAAQASDTNASGGAGTRAEAYGGTGGAATGAGFTGGAGGKAYIGTISGGVVTAGKVSATSAGDQRAIATANVTGGAGGRGYGGASGGAGASETLTNAVGGSAPGERLYLHQTATGGAGGYSAGGTAGAAGTASSSLTLSDTTATYVRGYSTANGGAGGGGSTSATAGGAATASVALSGANEVLGWAYANGGTGGAIAYSGSGSGTGGAGGAATVTGATAATTSTASELGALAGATGGAGGTGRGAGHSGGAGGAASITGVVAATNAGSGSTYATADETGGAGGRGYSGAAGGAGANSSLTNAVSGTSVGGDLDLRQRATGGAGGYGSGAAGAAGTGSSSLIASDTSSASVSGYSKAYGGAGGGSNTANGAAGGAASATLSLTGIGTVTADAARATGGAGGYSYAGTGGAGGAATASGTGVSTTTGSQNISGYAYATGGAGGADRHDGSGGVGGAVTGATSTATESSTSGGRAYARTIASGGTGGAAAGTGHAGGAGGGVSGATATATSGYRARASVSVAGGAGGKGYSGAAGGAGANASLTNAVSGTGSGAYVNLHQTATGGAGGYSAGGAAGLAGGATSSLTTTDSTVSTLRVYSTAYGGAGGGGSGATSGAAGGAANASSNATAVQAVYGHARAGGGDGGSATGTGTGGAGGAATAGGSAVTTTTGSYNADFRAYAAGGTGGGSASGSGAAGGAASGDATATQSAATGSRAYAYLGLTGGTGGQGSGAGHSGGAGGTVSVGTVTASGFNARTVVHATGGAGGRGVSGASGAAGQSESLTNAATATAAAGGYLDQSQTATGGAGGYSSGGTAGAGGAGTSSLTIGNSTVATITGYSLANGGAGGGGGAATAGASGGIASATLSVTGSQTVNALRAHATGGAGGRGYGSANGGTGGSASASSTAVSTTNASFDVEAQSYATGGNGGVNYSSGNAGAGGATTGSVAHATETSATGGRADAYAGSAGGAGGRSTSGVGGAGGAVSGTSATASGHSARVLAYQTGGHGGSSYGSGDAGGAGASSTLSNAVSATTTGGYERLYQRATGGYGGRSSTGTGGAGGAGTSSLTFNDNTANPIHATSIYARVRGYGGAGGLSNSDAGGAGGAGSATANVTGAYTMTVFAEATGGAGGSGTTSGAGGNATATATGTTTSLSNTIGATATVTADATAGAGSTTGAAKASATAETANGQQATANSTASGGSDTGSTTATTLSSGLVTNVTATTSTSGGGTLTGESGADIGGGTPYEYTTLYGAYASAVGSPDSSVNSIISANSNINAELGSSNANAVLFGDGAMAAYGESGATGTQTLTSSETFTLDAASLSGDLILGLASPIDASGFTSFSITTKVGGTTIAAGTETFTTLASANAFFTNDALNLGSFSHTNGLTVQVTETMITSVAGSDFADEIVLGATGGNGPPVFAGPTSEIIGQSHATPISGVNLSESGAQTGVTYTVTVSDSKGLLSLTKEGADTVTGSGSTSVTVTGSLSDIQSTLTTLSDTDATAGSDTIVLNATGSAGGAATPFDIAVTVNGPPVVTAPSSVSTSAGKATAISGISMSETGNTAGETFTVTLKDTHGLLTVDNPLGAGVSGAGTTDLTISGSEVVVNAALATLSDTDSVSPSDVISISALDSLGNTGTGSVSVNVTSAPVITAPASAVIGVGKPDPLGTISLAEAGSASNATFTITLADASGDLSATASGAATASGGGTTSLTVHGTLADINNTLTSLRDTDASLSADTITINATDQSGAAATPVTIAVGVNGAPQLTVPTSALLGQNHATTISGVALSESGNTANATMSVTLTDTSGLIGVNTAYGESVTGNNSTSVTVSGTFAEVQDALSGGLTDLESSTSSDTLSISGTDGFGNVTGTKTVALTVNGQPIITAPSAVSAGVSKATAIAGVSLAESGDTTGESFTVTVADTNGLLSVTSNPGDAGISGSGTKTLSISGTLTQVNQALANLSDTDASLAADTITLNATDSLENSATQKSIAVTVVNGPVITVPGSQLIGVSKAAPIAGVSISESGALETDPFTVTLSDAHGALSVTAGSSTVAGSGTTSVTISGTLQSVNATLATLDDTDAASGFDPITLNATDQFGFTAGAQTIPVTVAGLPVVNAPSSFVVALGVSRTVGGVSVSEPNATGTEGLTVTLSDTNGLLSIGDAFGASVTSGGTNHVTISGTFTEVNDALTTLADTDSVNATDTISIGATDQFGNTPSVAGDIAVTVNSLPVIAAPSSLTASLGHATPIAGVSVSESGSTSSDSFTVTLTDANGLLSVGGGSGASVSGQGTAALSISGSLSEVNTALGTLSDTDSVLATDTITIKASDTTLGGVASAKTITVSLANGPVIGTPAGGVTLGVGKEGLISGVTLSESGASSTETFTMTLSDTNGVLVASAAGGGTVSGSGSTHLSLGGTLSQIATILGMLEDTDETAGSDSIILNASDQFGAAAAQQTLTVTVNGAPVIVAPASAVVGVNQNTAVLGVGISENGNTTGETISVTVADTHGLLTASASGGAVIGSNGTTSIAISGTFAQVSAALATLTDKETGISSDTISLSATDGFGNAASAVTVPVTVNGAPIVSAPSTLALGAGKPGAIAGVSISETGVTTNETFTVTLTDANGVLSASNAGGAGVSAPGTTLTINGSLTQVNAALATLSDDDSSATPDTILLSAADSLGNSGSASISVSVANGPVLSAPASAVVGIGKSSAIAGVSVAESGAASGETFTVTLTDGVGLLSATASGGATVSGGGTKTLTVSGLIADVNATLASLHDVDSSGASDTITVNASDSFGNTAGAKTVAVTVNSAPAVLATSPQVVGVSQTAAIAGVGVSETGVTLSESLSVVLTDATGDLSASAAGGATISGAGTTSLHVSGTFAQVNAALASLTAEESANGSDTIEISATDGFGNAGTGSVALTINGKPVVSAPSATTVGIGKAGTIAGISLSETGVTTNETFIVTLSDTHGVLSATATGGASVSAPGETLTIDGTLSQVNATLATLSDTDSTLTADTIAINATDSLGNSGAGSIAVTVANGPVIAAPASAVIGVGRSAAISGVSVSESGGTASEQYSVTVSDTNGLLSTSNAGGATVSGGGTTRLTLTGTLTQVNAALSNLDDTDSTAGTDTLTVNASDAFGNAAGAKTVAVTVNGAPSISAPSSATLAQGAATAIAGLSVSETGNTTTSGETFTIVVSDGSGALAATTGVSGGGGTITASNSGKTLTIVGALSQVDADLTTLTDDESSTSPDTLTVAATDSFSNSATSKSVALTVTPASGSLSVAAPAATIGVGRSGAIPGVTISESPVNAGETFTVTLSDTNGALSANATAAGGGGTITSSNGGKTLKISGSLSQVNADLTTLADTDAIAGSDLISVGAADSNGGSAGPDSIDVTVNGAPSISASSSATLAQGAATAIAGLSVSETGNTTTSGETFTIVVSDGSGALAATTGVAGGGGTITASNSGKTLTIVGALSQVDADLTTLTDDESSTNPDTLTVAATDSFGNSATSKSVALTVSSADRLSGTGETLSENILFNDVTLASFTDSNLLTPASDLLATITWGDGTQSTGTVTGSDGSFQVLGSHAYAGPGQDDATIELSKIGANSTASASTTLNVGVLLGDANGNGVTDPGEHTLFVPELAAQQLLDHPASSDLRVSMISEALQAQIKIDQGAVDPGLQSAGFGLISDAANWLLGDAPFVYSPTGGNVDTNHNGVLDAGPTSAGEEYNTTSESFTTPPVKTTMAAGEQYVDAVSSTPHAGDLMINGNELLSALTAFNAGELVTLMGGTEVGWESGGSVIDTHANTATGFLTVLKDHHVIAGATET